MRPKEASAFLRAMVEYPKAPATFVWGPPGVGKSTVCKAIAADLNIGFVDLRLALMDPTDLRGIPIPEEGKARWLPPSALPTTGRGILLLDELNLAVPLVQASAYQLILDRRIGEYVLPEGWTIFAAGNKTEHRANTYKMAAPLGNRLIHIDFEHNIDDWREWALKNGVKSEVMEFISFRPDLLFQFDPKRQENAFPTPRSWEFVSRILEARNGLSDKIVEQAIAGTVGSGAATEFLAYLRLRAELPAIDDILNGSDFVPDKMDVACALATALVVRAEPGQYERLLRYSERLTPEVCVLLGKLLILKDKETVLSKPAWKAWAQKHYALLQ